MQRALSLLALSLLPGCRSVGSLSRTTVDPIVVVHAEQGDELAVSTDYGIVFLGRNVRGGRVEFSAWFGDGPSREEGVVEDVGGGLYATDAEIALPSVPLAFVPPPAGTRVIVRGRRDGELFEFEAVLASDPRLEGVVLEPGRDLDRLEDSELGAGVFLVEEGRPSRLLGLLSGRVEFSDGKRYLTTVGPDDLWRLVVRRRNSDRPKRRVYREDVM